MDLLIVIGAGLIIWLVLTSWWAIRKGNRIYAETQRNVERLISGLEPELYHVKFSDINLRPVQIIAQSIEIVKTTKSAATRESRLAVIARNFGALEARKWRGLSPASRKLVTAAVARIPEEAIVLAARAASDKHLKAARRAAKAETRQRYFELAEDELMAVRQEVSDETVRAQLETAIERLAGAFAEPLTEPRAGPEGNSPR